MTLYRLRTVVLDCSGETAVVSETCDLRALTIDQAKVRQSATPGAGNNVLCHMALRSSMASV